MTGQLSLNPPADQHPSPDHVLEAQFDAEVALLNDLHGVVLREAGDGDVAEWIDQMVSGASSSASGSPLVIDRLDVQDAARLARALTVHFHLINLAEQRDRARRQRRRGELSAGASAETWPTMSTVNPGVDRLSGLSLHPVFTAHPTEARRRAVSSALVRVATQLDQRAAAEGTEEDVTAQRRLLEEVNILHRTSLLRTTPPQPTDEVRTLMAMFDQTLFHAVPLLYRSVERAYSDGEPGSTPPPVPAFVRFGTWVGGDRDGNPFVTAAVTRQTMAIHADHVLRALGSATGRVARSLTMSERSTPASAALKASLANDAASDPNLFAEIGTSSPQQPHRHKLLLVAERIKATREGRVDLAYRRPEELVAELRCVQVSLRDAGDVRAAYGELQNLIWQAETFGFHLASIEVRQHSAVHDQAIADLVGQLPESSGSLLEQLDRLAREGWPDHVEARSAATIEVLDTLRVMAYLQERWGEASCGRYIVSFTQSAEHLAAVAALARLACGDRPLRLQPVPLFETGRDLAHAVEVLEAWVAMPSAQQWLDAHGRALEVMVGYSDSAKDVGPASATLTLYQAQSALVAWASRHDITLTIFHGRGGSLGRGGGPVHRAILAQPPGSVGKRFKVTEQGEVIFARYADIPLAASHLERLTSAVLLADTERTMQTNRAAEERFAGLASTIDSASRAAYLALVRTPGFADLLAEASPLEELGQLRLGSRPARRSGATTGRDLADFRAIPWVFAWAQIRANVPGWYGLGSGLEAVGDPDLLRSAYAQWPLFSSLIDIAEMSLAKTNPDLARAFLDLGERPDITSRILDELERTRRWVLQATGQHRLLEHKPHLDARLRLRAADVDALSRLQLRALQVMRGKADVAVPEQEHQGWGDVLLLTVHGAAAGLQNTG